jgi:hypothetical protein
VLTKELVEKALPANLRSAVTDAFVDQINNIVADPEVAEQVRSNFISYTQVLKDGKFKTEDYLNAVAYVSFKLMGLTNTDAYLKAFPQRYQALLAKGTSPKDISAYVAAYARGKLVNLILEQTMVPTWVLNQDLHQQAIETQADLMVNAKSEMVRTQAANSLLTHLKKPDPVVGVVSFDARESPGMTALTNMLQDLARRQRQAIQDGMPAREIASQRIIDAEVLDETPKPVGIAAQPPGPD